MTSPPKEATTPDAIRILVADNHALIRIGVRNLLQAEAGMMVVKEVEDGDETITETLDLLPDILLLDLTMPRLPGLEAMRAIMNSSPQVKILLLSHKINAQHIIEALQIGACGIVTHDGLTSHLAPAIRSTLQGEFWLGEKSVPSLVKSLHEWMQQAATPEHKGYNLTRREIEVISCIVEGCGNRDIARKYDLSEETVKRHLSNIFDKLGVSTRLELALFAIAHHLVAPAA